MIDSEIMLTVNVWQRHDETHSSDRAMTAESIQLFLTPNGFDTVARMDH